MIANIIYVACAFVCICGIFKLCSGYGVQEGCAMMLISTIIAALIYNNTVKVDDDFLGELNDTVEEAVEVTGRHFYVEDEVPSIPDTITVVKKFKPIEPVYDTVEVIEELEEEFPLYDMYDVIEIETTENLNIDSLMAAHNADSVHVEIIE